MDPSVLVFLRKQKILKDTQAAQEASLVKINKANPPKRQPDEFYVIEFFIP